MSLTVATLLFGGALLIAAGGLWLLSKGKEAEAPLIRFAKSGPVGVILLAIASIWFLYHVTQLGEADFGDFKQYIFLLFALVAIGSAIFLREYLAIRAVCALFLLAAALFLDAAFNQPPAGRLFMVSGIYLGILVSLYLAVSPFRWRDFFTWLFRKPNGPVILAGILGAYGLICLAAILTY